MHMLHDTASQCRFMQCRTALQQNAVDLKLTELPHQDAEIDMTVLLGDLQYMHPTLFQQCTLFPVNAARRHIGRDVLGTDDQTAVRRYLQIGVADDSCRMARIFRTAVEPKAPCRCRP